VKNPTEQECPTLLKKILLQYQKSHNISSIGYDILKNKSDIDKLTEEEKIRIYCSNTMDGVFDCP